MPDLTVRKYALQTSSVCGRCFKEVGVRSKTGKLGIEYRVESADGLQTVVAIRCALHFTTDERILSVFDWEQKKRRIPKPEWKIGRETKSR